MHESTRLIRASEVCELAALSHATIYRLIKQGLFPKPIKIGQSAVRWRADEIEAHIERLSAERPN